MRDTEGHQQVSVTGMRLLETVPMALIVSLVTALATSYATGRVNETQINVLVRAMASLEGRIGSHTQLEGHPATIQAVTALDRLVTLQSDRTGEQLAQFGDRLKNITARIRVLESTAIGVPKAEFYQGE